MTNSFDDIPFFDEEPQQAQRKAPALAQPAGNGGLGIAARAMAA
ncbi:Hypothetical protein, partial CDS, partial [Neorhizobium galegae bv. orientalis]